MGIFSYDSKFSQVLLRASQSCMLNAMWFACSLPVITIGASTTALYSVTLRIADDRDGELTKQFFRAFRDNFAQATRLWLIMLGAGIVLGTDGYITSRMRAASTGVPAVLWTLNLALIIVLGIIWVIVMEYVFPFTAYVSNTDMEMLKNSFLIGIRYLFCSIMIFVIYFSMFFLVVAVFTPMIIFGVGLCALLSSYLLIRVLRLCACSPNSEPEEEGTAEE